MPAVLGFPPPVSFAHLRLAKETGAVLFAPGWRSRSRSVLGGVDIGGVVGLEVSDFGQSQAQLGGCD